MPLPDLPSELWFYTFHLAAGEPPAQFDPLAPSPDFYDERSNFGSTRRGEEVNAGYLQRQMMRRRLVLVSKKWRRLALPILLEYVLLLSVKAVRSFSQALERDWQGLGSDEQLSTSTPRTIGRFTRYINLHLTGHTAFEVLAPGDAESIARSFRFCFNLITVSISGDPGPMNFSKLVMVQIRAIARGLRCITIPDVAFPTRHPFVENMETLEVLRIHSPTVRPDLPLLILLRLHSLTLPQATLPSAAEWDLPSLRRVYIVCSYHSRWEDKLAPFFKAHGSKIRALNATRWASRDLDLIVNHCTSLTEITIAVHFFTSLEPLLEKLETVELDMYLEGAEQLVMMQEMTRGMDMVFKKWAKRVSNLKSIRLVEWDLKNFWDWRWSEKQLESWRGWIEKAHVEGIRFVFDYGNDVVLPMKLEAGVYYRSRDDYAALVANANKAVYGRE
jgi:hypothetical protein